MKYVKTCERPPAPIGVLTRHNQTENVSNSALTIGWEENKFPKEDGPWKWNEFFFLVIFHSEDCKQFCLAVWNPPKENSLAETHTDVEWALHHSCSSTHQWLLKRKIYTATVFNDTTDIWWRVKMIPENLFWSQNWITFSWQSFV